METGHSFLSRVELEKAFCLFVCFYFLTNVNDLEFMTSSQKRKKQGVCQLQQEVHLESVEELWSSAMQSLVVSFSSWTRLALG